MGYTAKALVPHLSQIGFDIVGTTRSLEKIVENSTLIDFFAEGIEYYLSKATHVLLCIPPVTNPGDLVLFHYADLFKRHAPHIRWIGYLSSTGVYGDYQGEWVDEESVCRPESFHAKLRLEAEQAWMAFASQNNLPLHVFRLAGIYGPKRNALERIIAGKRYSIYKEEQVFSRIHVDDLVAVLLASINNSQPLSVYNIADDEPAPSYVVDAYAASLLQSAALSLVNIEDASLSPMEKEFYSANRRVSNGKIKRELHITLKYPTFRQGLINLCK